MNFPGWIAIVLMIAFAGAGIVALVKIASQVSNNNDEKEP